MHLVHGVLIALRLEMVERTTKAWGVLYDTLSLRKGLLVLTAEDSLL